MKGFKLDGKGDLVIVKNEIQMVEGNELKRQTVQSVLGTNKGEWVLNPEEGINFRNILGKRGVPSADGENEAMKQMYQGKIADMTASQNELAKRLEKRMDGDL